MDKNIRIVLGIVILLAIAFISYTLIGKENSSEQKEHPTHTPIAQTETDAPLSVEPPSEEVESDISPVPVEPEEEEEIIATVDFTLPEKANADEVVKFNDKSKNATSHWWNFGDGNISNDKNPQHKYKTPRIYTVKLRINGEKELIKEKTILINENKTTDIRITKSDNSDKAQTSEKEVVDIKKIEVQVQEYFNKIADDTTPYAIKKDIKRSLDTLITSEKIPVQFIREGKSANNTYYEYYQSLNITGGQKITKVEITGMTSENTIAGLNITEQK